MPTTSSRYVAPRPRTLGGLGLWARAGGAVEIAQADLTGRLDGRSVVVFRIDPTDRNGALSAEDSALIARAAHAALQGRRPLVGIIASSGADILGGMAALHGWGLAAKAISACSGVVPVLMIVDGPAVSGPALLLGLADVVVMTDSSYAFVSGPSMVADFTGLVVDNVGLGGTATHARQTGLPALTAPDLAGAIDAVASILSFLPDHVDCEPPIGFTDDITERDAPELDTVIPDSSTGSYDVRRVIEGIGDSDTGLLELKGRWAPNLVTAFTTVAGRPVGVVANQPLSLAGTLDIPAAQKGAWFVGFCDAFNVPILTIVDTPGYFPGKDLEWRGMIRHGAQMAYAYAEATVPRICIVLRKAYGGAYIVMDCKTMGNDLCAAWPTAELAVMGAKGAVQILHRRESDAARLAHELDYQARYLNPYVAAERGFVDAVIAPHESRRLVARTLDLLRTKQERLIGKRHGNSPL